MRRTKTAPWLLVAATVLGCLAAYTLGALLQQALPLTSPVHAEEEAPPPLRAVADREIVGGEERGIIRIGERTVLEIQTLAGGLSGYERSMIVAKRLNDALDAGVKPEQIRAGQVSGMPVVQAGQVTLITVTPLEAARHSLTEPELASRWAVSVAQALGGFPAPTVAPQPLVSDTPAPATPEQPPAPTEPAVWQPAEEYGDKIVPILSVLHGTRIGAARVNGPKSALDKVQAVAQLELAFRDTLHINVYVPISTSEPGSTLSRVQGVGITGVADMQVG